MGALDDVTVLDLSRLLAGPYCTQTFSDLGATVWKIEPPWGEDTRKLGPPFVGDQAAYYLSGNRGKKSVAVNLKEPKGQELVRGLARQADVLVENFKTGDLARYGLDYESVAEINPRIVYASITGFGHTGPRATEPAVDTTLQGLTGLMSITGEADGPPVKVGVAVIDLFAGLLAGVGVLAALRERERSGRGQALDLSLFDVGLMSMVNVAQNYFATGEPPGRLGNAHPQIVPYQGFEASDGDWFMLACVNDDQFQRLAETIGQPSLSDSARFRTNADRVANHGALAHILEDVFRSRTRSEWVDTLSGAKLMALPINNFAEALAEPQAEARRVTWDVPHPSLGSVRLMANALQNMSRTPAASQGHPPLLGEHTFEVLEDKLSLNAAELQTLEDSGVIKDASSPQPPTPNP